MAKQSRMLSKRLKSLLPWLAGAGFAIGHIAATSSCTLPKEGRCASCGGCVLALGSLVAWAVLKKRSSGEFFQSDDHGAA